LREKETVLVNEAPPAIDLPSKAAPEAWRSLVLYLVLTWVWSMLLDLGYFDAVTIEGPGQWVFASAIYTSYHALYLVPIGLFVLLAQWALKGRCLRVTAAISIIAGAVMPTIMFSDRVVLGQFGFHLNGFVFNLLTTPGGIESMGATSSTQLTAACYVLGFVAMQGVLYYASGYVARRFHSSRVLALKALIFLCLCLSLTWAGQFITFGVARFRRDKMTAIAGIVPFYIPVRFNSLGKRLGFEPPPRQASLFRAKSSKSARLKYPLTALKSGPSFKNYNVLWLVAESLRSDSLSARVMPNCSRFAAEHGINFSNHYSGGNGTRWGMFSMFYGLYPILWNDFLGEHRGPVLIDELIRRRYAMSINTSARFTYPEFDATIFSQIPSNQLNQVVSSEEYRLGAERRDVDNTSVILEFIKKQRSPNKPFFAFMFYESTHSPYSFDEDKVLESRYLKSYNYLSNNFGEALKGVKARYRNACHHVDRQIGKLLKALKESGKLKNTIVVITGDHGEEFMEFGRLGHNSQFSTPQLKVPFILAIPGQEPRRYAQLSSHVDIAPTILRTLGITNKVEDFSYGIDLLGHKTRKYLIVCDWSNLALLDEANLASFQIRGFLNQQLIFDRQMKPVENRAAVFKSFTPRIRTVLDQLRRFKQHR